jgi:purine-nucleoside phosphorylase
VSALSYYDQVAAAAEFIRRQSPDIPTIAVVLGSGLGDFASDLDGAASLEYAAIPHWPVAAVIGHPGG